MEFELSFNNREEVLQLPVPPPTFSISKGNINKTVITANTSGEINLLGKGEGRLAEITLSSFFPAQEYYFCDYRGFPKPYQCVEIIERWRKSGQPIRLIITDTDINIAVGIENFEYGEKDGTGDVYFTLALKEYKFLNVPAKNLTQKGYSQENKRPSNRNIPDTYKIKSGDTLWAIAKKLTGNGANYKKIAQKNGIKNPNKIYPGQKLVI